MVTLAGLKRFTYGPGVSGISESAVLNSYAHGGERI